jgi:lipid-binding SYLF domain-containing protein
VGSLPSEASIPPSLLRDCAGLAILSVARAGAGWSLGVGSGLVVARAQPGGAAAWSPPSALLSLSSAVGWQLGVEVQDLILVLRSRSALRAFAAAGQLGVGGSVSLAAGPLGRAAAARALATLGGGAVVYSYCATRGAFAGVALEGTLLATRDSLNRVRRAAGGGLSPRGMRLPGLRRLPRAAPTAM